jgi:uncharacterized protein YjlB
MKFNHYHQILHGVVTAQAQKEASALSLQTAQTGRAVVKMDGSALVMDAGCSTRHTHAKQQ